MATVVRHDAIDSISVKPTLIGHQPYLPSEPAPKTKILLLEPYYPAEAKWGSLKTEQGFLPPLGLISIYSWLRWRGFDVTFRDTQFGDVTEASLRTFLRAGQFEVIGIPTFTPTADYCFWTAKLCKEVLPNCRIVFGNIHASSMPALTMDQCPQCDFIVRHEGEYTFEELVRTLAKGETSDFSGILGLVWRQGGKTVANADRPLIGDLDTLPSGFYSDLDLSAYVPHVTQYSVLPNYPLVTQRGCPYPCSYCEAANILGKKQRVYSPSRVIEELKLLKEKKGARGIYFQDSTFTMNRKYTMELLQLMIKEKLELLWTCNTRSDRVDPELLRFMYDAGCRTIFYGIESGNPESLKVIHKQCTVEQQTQGVGWTHEAGIRMLCNYIICLPGEDEAMVEKTVRYAQSLRSQMALFYLPVPFPGSALYEECRRDGGLIRPDATWSDYLAIDFNNPVYVNPKIGKERMQYWYRRAFRDYYLTPSVWLANLRSIRSGHDVRRLLRGARALSIVLGSGMSKLLKGFNRGYHGQAAPILE
ncbi:MAG: radical SAM protein [Elusimicrobia bacterium]|nr:radical SAM protein [Elusimicrobiota bacterium]